MIKMDKQKVFATAMWGFEKKAVLDYIYEQDMLFKKKESDLERQLAEYEQKLETAEAQAAEIERYQEQLDALNTSYKEEKDTLADLQERYDRLSAETEQLIRVAGNKDRELQLQIELNSQLKSKCELLENKLKVLADHLIAAREQATVEAAQSANQTESAECEKSAFLAVDNSKATDGAPVFVAEIIEAAQPTPPLVEVTAAEAEPKAEIRLPATEPTQETPQECEAEYEDLKTELDEFRNAVSKTLLNFEAALARLESGKQDIDPPEKTVFFR